MQIISKTVKLTGTEKEDIPIGLKVGEGLVFVLENRGPAPVHIFEVGPLEPNRFVVIGGMDQIKLHPPNQFSTIDVTVFTK